MREMVVKNMLIAHAIAISCGALLLLAGRSMAALPLIGRGVWVGVNKRNVERILSR